MIGDFGIVELDKAASTNTVAMQMLPDLPDRSVIWADEQTAGRGQRGNSWESEPGRNLTFSIVVKPASIKASRQFLVSEAVSLAVCSCLEGFGVTSSVKWPNDIYCGDRKICGILIENMISGDRLSASVIGVGLNVNQKEFLSDAPNPVSLLQVSGRESDRRVVLERILSAFSVYYGRACSGENLDGEYLSRMYRRGERHRFADNIRKTEFEGVIEGIDECACMLVRDCSDGTVRHYAFKEIAYILGDNRL